MMSATMRSHPAVLPAAGVRRHPQKRLKSRSDYNVLGGGRATGGGGAVVRVRHVAPRSGSSRGRSLIGVVVLARNDDGVRGGGGGGGSGASRVAPLVTDPPPPETTSGRREEKTRDLKFNNNNNNNNKVTASSRKGGNSALSALQSSVKSALGLLTSTVKVGEAARESLNNTINNTPGVAVRGLVTGVLSDIAGQSVTVESIRLYPDGVALENLAIGEELTVDKVVVRARLQPLLAVLGSWKSTPANMTAPPILIESIRLKGINSTEADFKGIRRAFNLYVHAPGAIIIGSLKMYDISATIVPHEAYEGCPKPPVTRVLRLASMELANVDSRLPIAKLAGCMVAVDEGAGTGAAAGENGGVYDVDLEEGLRGTGEELESRGGFLGGGEMGQSTTPGARGGGGGGGETTGGSQPGGGGSAALVPNPNNKRPAANRDPFAGIRGFVPPMLMSQVDNAMSPEVLALANTSQAVFESIAPVIAGDATRILTVDVAQFAGTEALLDIGIVAALLTAGLPRRFLANGGALMVKLVESGVGVVLLERAELLKVMVERRLLERMLDLDLMSPMLDKPELTKEMFRSGVVKGVMNNGVLEALLAAGKEDVVVALLRGPMLEVLMDTGLLPAMMTFQGGDDEEDDDPMFRTPPTGSFDDGEEFEIPFPEAGR